MQTPPRGVHKEQETGESLFKKMRTEKRTQQQRQSSGLPHYGAIHKTRGKIFGIFDFPFVDIFIKYGLCCKIFVRLNPSNVHVVHECPIMTWGAEKCLPAPTVHRFSASSYYFLKFIKGSRTKSLAYFIIDHLFKAVGSSLVFHILKTSKN